MTIVQFVWFTGTRIERLHRWVDQKPYPQLAYDGFTTGETKSKRSECRLTPVCIAKTLIWCTSTHASSGTPSPGNQRYHAMRVFQKHKHHRPHFIVEQVREFEDIEPVMSAMCEMRQLGISLLQFRIENSQVRFEIGPCEGINAADQVWLSRAVLGGKCKISAIQFSTEQSRSPDVQGGYQQLLQSLGMKFCIGDYTGDIRVPVRTRKLGYGPIEDRRTTTNDPYKATAALLQAALDS